MSAGELWRRLRAALHAGRMQEDLAEEMRLHVDLRAEANAAAGMSESEARAAALRRFGNSGVLREESRDAWGWSWLDALRQDARYALRQVRRAPAFAAVAIVTSALGIGLSTAAFTLYDALTLRPLPVSHPDNMVRVVRRADRATLDELPWTTVDRIRQSRLLHDVVVTSAPEVFATAPGAEPITLRFVSPDYFEMLGVSSAAGRALREVPSGIVVSRDFWLRRLGGDPGAPGRTLTVQGIPLTIAGVAPAGFSGTGLPPAAPDGWVRMDAQPLLTNGVDWTRTAAAKWQVLARRAERTTSAQANAELAALSRIAPDTEAGALVAKPATYFQTDSGEFETFGQLIGILMAAVGLILLIGCLNLVNLVAARNAAREREVTMRLALGASRGRVARQLCTETVVIGLLGGSLGMLLSLWGCRVLAREIMGALAQLTGGPGLLTLDLRPNWHVLGYAAGLSLVVGLAVGFWPALRAARGDVSGFLKQGATEPRRRGVRRHLLLTSQIAGSLVLLSTAGALLAGVWRSRQVDSGFDVAHLLVLYVDRSLTPDSAGQAALTRAIVERMAQIPGMRAAAWGDRSPYVGHSLRTLTDHATNRLVTIGFSFVSGDWFAATGIPLVAGRSFTIDETIQHRPVVIISESLVRRLWPGQNVVGRVVPRADWLAAPDSQSYTIIGVARDVRNTWLSRVDQGYEYFPGAPAGANVLMLRTAGPPEAMMAPVFAALAELRPDLPAHAHLVSMTNGPLAFQHLIVSAPAMLGTGLATLGLLLAGISLFGLVAHAVTRRTREIGVRIALGASRARVLGSILRETTVPLAGGAAIGALGSIGVAFELGHLLAAPDAPDLTFGTGLLNPAVFLAVLALLATVVATAALLPALRATRIDAMTALRQD